MRGDRLDRLPLDPACRAVDDERGQSLSPRLRTGPGDHRQEVGERGVRDEGLRPLEQPAVLRAVRRGADRREVRAGVGFGHGKGRDRPALLDRRQEPALLLVGARERDRERTEPLHHEHQVEQPRSAGELFADRGDRRDLDLRGRAAVGRRDDVPEKALSLQLAQERAAERFVVPALPGLIETVKPLGEGAGAPARLLRPPGGGQGQREYSSQMRPSQTKQRAVFEQSLQPLPSQCGHLPLPKQNSH